MYLYTDVKGLLLANFVPSGLKLLRVVRPCLWFVLKSDVGLALHSCLKHCATIYTGGGETNPFVYVYLFDEYFALVSF